MEAIKTSGKPVFGPKQFWNMDYVPRPNY